MNLDEILSNAFVVTSGGDRLKQFRGALDAAGLDGSLPREWKWCHIPGEGSMGNAVAQYSLVRHALESKMPFLVVFEDDAVPCDDAAERLVAAFGSRKEDTLCLSLGWSYDSDPDKGDDRGAKRRVYGSHAYALFGEKAYLAYMSAWEKNGRADVVLGLMEGSRLAPDNMFAQHTPAGSEGIHLPAGWTVNADVEREVDGEVRDRFSKARAEIARLEAEKTIHVVYTVDIQGQGAVPFADMLVSSVFSLRGTMSAGDRVHAHVIYGNIPADLMDRLSKFVTDKFKVSFTKTKPSDLAYMQTLTRHRADAQVRSWNGIVFARLWTALALPRLNRCIYLDNDTLVRKSLRPLWETDLGGKMLGMNMGTVPEYGYNSGVMLMDLAKMRSDKEMWSRLADFLDKEAKTFFCPDQTSINRFFKDEIHPIDRIWNYPPKPGEQNTKSANEAAIWHFYEGGKPHRLDGDEFGAACLFWNTVLHKAEEAAK